ncbi:MAG: ABC transporter ATP-binding protein, partial [Ectothiorhodospiraceae bacterium]
MIEVEQLRRNYGDFTAVDDVSFKIPQGEVVGLLGHNGAGKTTIMKMLTGYLEPSAGRIAIDGLDMTDHRREIQQRIGYLPENCPLYPDMTVLDYLEYRASLQGMPEADRPGAIRQAVERTELQPKALSPISTLSRGYRQRVGVAQAILHTPKFIILDEPTNGLDPSQIQHMRDLVRELARHATVLISTHILQEVEAVCERVLMMRRGKLALDARLADLGHANSLMVALNATPERAQALLGTVSGVGGVEPQGEQGGRYRYRLTLGETSAAEVAPNVARTVHEKGL